MYKIRYHVILKDGRRVDKLDYCVPSMIHERLRQLQGRFCHIDRITSVSALNMRARCDYKGDYYAPDKKEVLK